MRNYKVSRETLKQYAAEKRKASAERRAWIDDAERELAAAEKELGPPATPVVENVLPEGGRSAQGPEGRAGVDSPEEALVAYRARYGQLVGEGLSPKEATRKIAMDEPALNQARNAAVTAAVAAKQKRGK